VDNAEAEGMANSLTGKFLVRAFRPAFDDVNRLFVRTRDKIELRRHALKLRYWPDSITTEPSGQVVDLDWSWIRSLPGKKIGELRVHDTIGGQDNLRIIFFVGPPNERMPKTCIWILAVIQKDRDDFSTNNIAIFKARRSLVCERFYKDRS
jgi:hypothetical protein